MKIRGGVGTFRLFLLLICNVNAACPPNAALQARLKAGARHERTLEGVALPGRADGYPSGPPTDPYVRNSRIRFLRQSDCYPHAVPWRAVVRVGELKVSSLSPASGCSARRRLPSRGSLGPHFPTFTGTMRRYDCHLPISGLFACRSHPDTLRAPLVCGLPHGLVTWEEPPGPRQGLWSPGPPLRE